MIIFHKYPKIYYLDDELVKDIFKNPGDLIIEQFKYDGGNIRFTIRDGQLVFGSRTQELIDDDAHASSYSRFIPCIEHIKEKLKGKDLSKYEGWIFYGENMIPHTLGYDWQNIPIYFGLDIMVEEGTFLHPDESRQIFELDFGLDFVDEIRRYKAKDAPKSIDESYVPVSKYTPLAHPEQKAEGIVFKNVSKGLYAKYVRPKFKEENKIVFGGSKKYADNIIEMLVYKYCTNARIEKIIWKILDDGHELGMNLVSQLSSRVYHDIWEEKWKTIIKLNKEVNLGKFRKEVTIRSKALLNQVIETRKITNKEKD